jgi:hypothetical protein
MCWKDPLAPRHRNSALQFQFRFDSVLFATRLHFIPDNDQPPPLCCIGNIAILHLRFAACIWHCIELLRLSTSCCDAIKPFSLTQAITVGHLTRKLPTSVSYGAASSHPFFTPPFETTDDKVPRQPSQWRPQGSDPGPRLRRARPNALSKSSILAPTIRKRSRRSEGGMALKIRPCHRPRCRCRFRL